MRQKHKLVRSVGVNDATYATQIFSKQGNGIKKQVWRCPFYSVWSGMLDRCYSVSFKLKQPNYKDVSCCADWLIFSKFRHWMEQQDWEERDLDKDIILYNNKIYSPTTCAFVSRTANSFVTDRSNVRGDWPLGVHWDTAAEKLRARCCNPFTKKREHLGLFTCAKEAHEAWRQRKHELAQLVAETESDTRVVESLKKRYSFEEWYKYNPI